MRFVVVLVVLGGVLSSCHKQEDTVLDPDGVTIILPSLWKTPISNDGQLSKGVVRVPIQYGSNNVLVGANLSGQRSIISLKAQDGTKNWEWSDLLGTYSEPNYKDPIDINLRTCYRTADKLFFPCATSSYCVDLNSGATQWKHKINLARVDVSAGIGESYLSAGGTYGVGDDERLYRGNINSNSPEAYLLTPRYNAVANPAFNGFGMIKGMVPFIAQSDTLLAILFTDPNADTHYLSYSVSSLYNLTKQKWIYERTVMNPSLSTGNILYPKLYESKIYYASGLGLHCYDVMTGGPIWSVPFSQGFGFSGFMIVDNKLIANCEDTYAYCLDPATGRQLWKEKSSGTSTPMSYLNGVVYFSGGGDGKLHALDVATGQHLWKLKSPDLSTNSGAWFYGVCVAVAGKDGQRGQVIVTTGLNAYGYEAAR